MYHRRQIEDLEKLRRILGEKGFLIFDLKRRKHPREFMAVQPTAFPRSAALVGLYRGKVRVRFYYLKQAWGNDIVQDIISWFGNRVCFAKDPVYNPPHTRKYHPWVSRVPKKQLKELQYTGLSVSD